MNATAAPEKPLRGLALLVKQCEGVVDRDALADAWEAFGTGDPHGFGVRFHTLLRAFLHAMGSHTEQTYALTNQLLRALDELMDPGRHQKAMDAQVQQFKTLMASGLKSLNELEQGRRKEREMELLLAQAQQKVLLDKILDLEIEFQRFRTHNAAVAALLVASGVFFGGTLFFYALVYFHSR